MGLDDAIQRARDAKQSAISAHDQLEQWRLDREQRLRSLLEEFAERCRRDGIASEPIARLTYTKKHGGVEEWVGIDADAWAIFTLSDGEGGSAGTVYATTDAELVTARWVPNDKVDGWPFPHRRIFGAPGNPEGVLANKRPYDPWGMTLGEGWLSQLADPAFPDRVEANTREVLVGIENAMGAFLAARTS